MGGSKRLSASATIGRLSPIMSSWLLYLTSVIDTLNIAQQTVSASVQNRPSLGEANS